MKLLIDRNIERFSVTHRSVEEQQEVKWGTGNFVARVLRRTPVILEKHNHKVEEQLPYLASLCLQAKNGNVEFYSSFELQMEYARQKQKPAGYVGRDLLAGIHIHSTKEPVSRSVVFYATVGSGLSKTRASADAEREQMNFFASIYEPRYLEIRSAFQKAGFSGFIDDIFHLWTAEFNNLDAFLTLDFSFHRAWSAAIRKGSLKSSTAVMTPRDCCQSLHIEPIDIEAVADE